MEINSKSIPNNTQHNFELEVHIHLTPFYKYGKNNKN